MISLLQTSVLFALGMCIAFLCGYGILRYLLPDHLQEYRFVISIPSGYSIFVWLTFTISGAFSIIVAKAIWISVTILIGITIMALFSMRSLDVWREFGEGIRQTLLLSAPTICFLLLPFFFVGADTYLGSVNPDYTFALKDAYFVKGHLATAIGGPFNSFAPFQTSASHLPVHARYIGNLFALLMESGFSLSGRCSLTVALAVWMAAIPGSIYFLSRAALGFDDRVSSLAAFLCAANGPLALSYFLFFVGQNSVLALAPVLMTVSYVLLTRPSWKIFNLTAVLFCAMFWMYPVLLPYTVGPVLGVSVYLVYTGRVKLRVAANAAIALLGVFLISILPLGGAFLLSYAGAWQHLFRTIIWGQFFEEFLTEQSVVYFLGLTSYPFGGSLLAHFLGNGVLLVLIFSAVAVVIGLTAALLSWGRHASDRGPVFLIAITWMLFVAAWANYTFHHQYGYGLLKMSSWVQFALIPPAAYGLVRAWRLIRLPKSLTPNRLTFAAFAVIGLYWAGGNALSSLDYAVKGIGLVKGANVLGVSGNRDYLQLERAVPPMIGPDESIGLALSDAIQTEWATYYLREVRLSILSHLFLPLTEEHLYHDVNGGALNLFPQRAEVDNPFFHGAQDNYYLVLNKNTPEFDIIDQSLPKPIWHNDTFQLIRSDEAKDFLVTGRGFYQVEQSSPSAADWWPKSFRWTAEGGEIYLFRPRAKGKPYRLSLVLVSGFGLGSARRVVDFYRNGSLFDEVTINGSARVLTKPFIPVDDVEQIVFTIRERTSHIQRDFAIWNVFVPRDVRELNAAAAQIRVFASDDFPQSTSIGRVVSGAEFFEDALAFDGIEGNGWCREACTMTFVAPSDASLVRLKLLVPGADSIKFPYPISFDIDGHEIEAVIRRPGHVEFCLPFTPSRNPHAITIGIRPSQPFLPSGYEQRLRGTSQSVRFEATVFELAKTARVQASCSNCTRMRAAN